MTKLFKIISPLFFMLLLASCASNKTGDVSYLKRSEALVESFPELDVYHPRKSKGNPVVIFIHGGYWDEGKKETYGFLGRNFAKKDIVTVVPDYTLSPEGNYNTMAKEVAAAVEWAYDNIGKFNGDPDQIFLMGHSAGGHLIALAGTNPKYLKNIDLVKGIILNDAAALDMYTYLKENPPTDFHHYNVTWTDNEDNWKDASPIYFLTEEAPPFLIYVGTETYPSILSQNADFVKKLNRFQPTVEINYLPKKHVPMMRQFFYARNKLYVDISEFIESN